MVGVVTLTSILIYLETLSQNINILFPEMMLQLAFGYALIFFGGLGVGKISEVAATEEELIKQITLNIKGQSYRSFC